MKLESVHWTVMDCCGPVKDTNDLCSKCYDIQAMAVEHHIQQELLKEVAEFALEMQDNFDMDIQALGDDLLETISPHKHANKMFWLKD